MVSTAMLSTAGGAERPTAQDALRPAIEKLLAAEQAAWNAGDSAAYAAAYTDDADFINIRGHVFAGKTAVQEQHARIFAGPFKGSTISIVLRKLTRLSERVALVDTDQTVTNFRGLPPGIVASSPGTLVAHFKYVAVEQADGSWKIAAAQNTAQLPN